MQLEAMIRTRSFRIAFLSILLFFVSALPVSAVSPNDNGVNCYKTLAPIPKGPRQEHGVAAIDNKIYLVAGMLYYNEGTRGQEGTVEIYDIKTNTWSDAPPLPVALHHSNVAAANGKVYVLGGLNGFNNTRRTVGTVFEFDPAVKQWKELDPMPKGTERGASAVAVKGNSIYLAGGLQPKFGDDDYHVSDLVSSYDALSNKWTVLPNLPEKRDHVGGVFVGDTFYVVGGRTGKPTTSRDTLFALKPGASQWTSLSRMPTGRGGIAAAAIGTKIYTFGGEGNQAPGTDSIYSECESYDTLTDKWTKEPAWKTPRHGVPAVTVGKTIYIMGGGLKGGILKAANITEAYGPESC
jgi:N-acetylneuraminic acid mutarotase